jgi:hypothetical protein
VHAEIRKLTESRCADVGRILWHRKGAQASPTLMLVKKWADFFTRNRKNHPNYPRSFLTMNLFV